MNAPNSNVVDTPQEQQTKDPPNHNPVQAKIIKDINEFIIACRRTKYQESVLFHKRNEKKGLEKSESEGKRQRAHSSHSRTWTAILSDLCEVMPLITDEQYALIARIVSLCLLAYLLPQTCSFVIETTDDRPLQRNGKQIDFKSKSEINPGHGLRQMESILDNSPQIRHLPSAQFDPRKSQDEIVSAPFWDFLHSGLAPFLSSRPMTPTMSTGTHDTEPNCGAADLLHVLSMTISSDLSEPDINYMIGSDDNGGDVKISMPNRVRCLVMKGQSEYFQITALQRAKIVNVLANSLVLPKCYIPQDNESLFMGSVLHLRASLNSFEMSALSTRQMMDARKALVSTAIDTECFAYVEMKALVKILVNSNSKRSGQYYNCRQDGVRPRSRELQAQNNRYIHGVSQNQAGGSTYRQQIIYYKGMEESICVYCSIGDLLCDLIVRYNGSRHYADGVFTSQALAELTVAIATLLSKIDCADQKESIVYSDLPTACTIAALLDAAGALFYFLLSPNENDTNAQELESGMKDALLECVIQLLGSQDQCIAKSASSLLSLAIAYENELRVDNVVGKIFSTLSGAFQNPSAFDCYSDIIEVMSKRSNQFAASMTLRIIEVLQSDRYPGEGPTVVCLRALLVISSHQPRIVSKQLDCLDLAIGSGVELENIAKQLAAVHIVSAGMVYKGKADAKKTESIDNTVASVSNSWSIFQLARLALTTANFSVASDLIKDRLLKSVSTPLSFLWLSSLDAVAEAEFILSREGCSGIASGLFQLDSALNKIRSIGQNTSFQIEFLSLRKDFLQLCLVLSNLISEMRLSNVSGGRSTRNFLHQQNVSRCFYMLGTRYHSLYKRYGIYSCQHSISRLRSHFSSCRFLGDVAKLFFTFSQKNSKLLSNSLLQDSLSVPQGDKRQESIQIIQRLRSDLINSFDNSLDPSTRGEILHQILNTVLNCPNPYPKCFTVLTQIPQINIQVAAKRDNEFKVLSSEHITPYNTVYGSPLTLRLSGSLPQAFFTKLNIPVSQLLAQISFSLAGPLQRDVDAEDRGKSTGRETELEDTIAASNLLPSNSKFIIDCDCPAFQKEGFYFMQVSVLARDVRCGEFELQTNFSNEKFLILTSSP